MGQSLADNTAKYTDKAFGYAEKAVAQIRRWRRRVSTRSSYVSDAAKSDVTSGGRAGAVHAFLTKPKNRRLLIADGVLAIVLVVSLMPHGSTQAATAALTMQRDAGETILDEPLVMDTFNLTAETDDFGAVELSWDKVDNAPGYVVYRYNGAEQTYDPITTITDGTVTSYVDTEATAGETASYQVTPLFALDQKANSNVVDVDVEVAKPELSLSVSDQDVSISWTAVDGADQYTLLRAVEEDGEYAEVAYVNEPEFLDEEMTPGRTYYYKVRAEKGSMVTETSDVVNTGAIPEPPKPVVTSAAESSTGTAYSSSENAGWSGGTMTWPMPANYSVCSYFGPRVAPTAGATSYHKGIDISCPYGSGVIAAAGGTVIEVSYDGARGNYVVVSHGGGVDTLYQHLSGSCVSVGQTVHAGETIAYAGSTGISTGCHLHFEVHVNGSPVNPMNYL